MIKFILRKILYGFLVLFGVITAIFLLFNVLPGDPARLQMGQHADKASIEIINRDLGRDKPLFTQYLLFLNDLSFLSVHSKDPKSSVYLDPVKYHHTLELFSIGGKKELVLKTPYFRRSYKNQQNVSEIIADTLPETVVLAFTSMLFASFFGILFGVICAVRKNSWIDRSLTFFSTLGMAAPSFLMAQVIALVFGAWLHAYTGLSNTGSLWELSNFDGKEHLHLENLILPAFTLGIRPLALITQLMRSSMLEVLSQDYIRTATAKGLGRSTVILKHAMKNSLNPVVTAISGWFAGLMAGAVFVEVIFNWNGIGYRVYDALISYDLPVVMGATLIFSTCFVVINICVDIAYGALDPRVRLR